MKHSRGMRQDIQGLRAVAVMGVLFFHFQIPGFSGGFSGVDVFFVISGFLMTKIISKGMEAGTFSFLGFYLARGRRIVPPLFILVFFLLLLGWFWLPTYDYQRLASEGNYALTFTSNIKYWQTAGYFDVDSHAKWFLHTWSLSVEWQFYIFYPIFLYLAWKIRPSVQSLFIAVLILFIFSFLCSCIITSIKPDFAFYQLPVRAWEMAAGGLVVWSDRYLFFSSRARSVFYWLGWILLLASFYFLSDLLWPGAWAFIPVAGSLLLMFRSDKRKFLLENQVMQWIGDRSYSIYLWHWPFVVLLYYLGFQEDWLWVGIAVFGGVLFGHISFSIVEKPWRGFFAGRTHRWNIVSLFLGFLVCYSCSLTVRNTKFDDRLAENVERIAAEAKNRNPLSNSCFQSESSKGAPGCIFGTDEIGAVMVGDSHALSTITAAGQAASLHNKGVVLWGFSSCPPIRGLFDANRPEHEKSRCKEFNEWVFKEIKKYPKEIPVIFVARFSSYALGNKDLYQEGKAKKPLVYFTKRYSDGRNSEFQKEFGDALIQTACEFAAERPVYMVRPIPEMPVDVPGAMSRSLSLMGKTSDIFVTKEQYVYRNRLVWEAQDKAVLDCGVHLLDPLKYFCDESRCFGAIQGRPIFYDQDHLSEYGNTFLIPMFEEIFLKPD